MLYDCVSTARHNLGIAQILDGNKGWVVVRTLFSFSSANGIILCPGVFAWVCMFLLRLLFNIANNGSGFPSCSSVVARELVNLITTDSSNTTLARLRRPPKTGLSSYSNTSPAMPVGTGFVNSELPFPHYDRHWTKTNRIGDRQAILTALRFSNSNQFACSKNVESQERI